MSPPNTPRELYDVYVFDVDGTLCLGDELLPTALETIRFLRRRDRRVVFISNDASQSPCEHAAQLTQLGIAANPAQFLTPTSILVGILERQVPGGVILALGTGALRDALGTAGFPLAGAGDAEEVDAVVVSHDRSFDYAQLRAACTAVRSGAKLYATNADAFRPTPDGGEPGTGAALAAVERCAGAVADAVAGKPTIYMCEALRDLVGRTGVSCLIIGDQLETDIRMALNSDMDSALVTTGVTDRTGLEASEIQPTYVIDRLSDLVNEKNWRHFEEKRELI